jgi:hypothetical protein
LTELWHLPTPYKPDYLKDVSFFSKSNTQMRVHGNDTEEQGGPPKLVAVKRCEISDEQIKHLKFPAYIKYDYGVSASGGRGGDCFQHMSVALDAEDLRAKLPFFCLPALKSFSHYGKPKSVRKVRKIV